jgi:hypothetical protein
MRNRLIVGFNMRTDSGGLATSVIRKRSIGRAMPNSVDIGRGLAMANDREQGVG